LYFHLLANSESEKGPRKVRLETISINNQKGVVI
jgi:hypothetical protein